MSEEKWVQVGFIPMSIRIRAGPVNFFRQPSYCSLRSASALPGASCRSTSVVPEQWLLSVHANCVAVSVYIFHHVWISASLTAITPIVSGRWNARFRRDLLFVRPFSQTCVQYRTLWPKDGPELNTSTALSSERKKMNVAEHVLYANKPKRQPLARLTHSGLH